MAPTRNLKRFYLTQAFALSFTFLLMRPAVERVMDEALEAQPTYWLVDSATAYLVYRTHHKVSRRMIPIAAYSNREWLR